MRPLLPFALLALAATGCKPKPEAATPLAGLPSMSSNPVAPGTPAGLPTLGIGAKRAALVGKAELTPANAETLIPHNEGTTWTYSVEIETQQKGGPARKNAGEVVWTVAASKKEGTGTRFLLSFKGGAQANDEQTWAYLPEKGYVQVNAGAKRRAFEPPQPILALPLRMGEDFKWEGFATDAKGRRNKSALVGQAVGYETVDTEIGPADALHVTSVNGFEIAGADGKPVPARSDTDVWLRPGVGIVRYTQTTRGTAAGIAYTLRLKDFTIK